MTDEQKRVHLRLISTLQIRSHFWAPLPWGFKRSADQEEILGARLRALQAAGYNRKDMKIKANCSCQTIIKHLGPYKKKGK